MLLLVWVLCFAPPPLRANLSVSTLEQGIFGLFFVIAEGAVGCIGWAFFFFMHTFEAYGSTQKQVTEYHWGAI